jgi:phosphoglycerate dehydrogenase-like enzyme
MRGTFQRIAILPELSLSARMYEQLQKRSSEPLWRLKTWPIRGVCDYPETDALLASWAHPITATDLNLFPGLRYVGLRGTSTARIDVSEAGVRGITIRGVGRYADHATAEFVISHILQHYHNSSCEELPAEARGHTLGLIGMGPVAAQVASIATALNMTVLYHAKRGPRPTLGVAEYRPLPTLLRESDVLSIHVPPGQRVFSSAEFALMKNDSMLIVTTIGLPFILADFVAYWPRVDRTAIFDLVAAQRDRKVLDTLPGCQVISRYAGRTKEAQYEAERQILVALDTQLLQGGKK